MPTLSALRLAVRSLARHPGPHLVAVSVLGLGIGAAVVIFAFVHVLLLEPLSVADGGAGVVRILQGNADGTPRGRLDAAAWAALRDGTTTLHPLVAATNMGLAVTEAEQPLNPLMRRVSPGWLELLGARAERGRTFVDEDFAGDGRRVAVLSWAFWQSRYGGDPDVVGRTIQLAYQDHEIVGVLSAGYHNPTFPDDPVLWLPLRETEPALPGGGAFVVLGRLAPGATTMAVASELETLAGDLRLAGPPEAPTRRFRVTTLRDSLVEDLRPALLALAVAVLLVLLVACANVAGLFLARAAGRSGEMTLRRALGAGGRHLATQLLAESLVVAAAAGAVGLVAAWATLGPLLRLAPAALDVPLLERVRIHPGVVLFAVGLVALTTLVFGLAPLAQNRREALHGVRATAGVGRVRGRRALVVVEIALSLVLVAAAGLVLRSLAGLRGLGLGFEPAHTLTLRVGARGPGFETPEGRAIFHAAVAERVALLPGVEAVGASEFLPMFAGGFGERLPVAAEAAGLPDADGPTAVRLAASPGYFTAFGQRLSAGRAFTPQDDADAPAVAVVTAVLAGRLWGDRDPVGKRLRLGDDVVEVVGVAGDVRGLIDAPEPPPLVFVPIAQVPVTTASLYVRAAPGVEVAGLQGPIEEAVATISRDAPVFGFLRVEQLVHDLEWRPRFLVQLLGAFAVLGLILAASGVYSVLAYTVTARRREMGVRMAVGADRAAVLRLVEGEALVLAAAGVALGLAGAVAAGTLLQSQLYGVDAADPATLGVASAILALAALAAGAVPALRAAAVDPAKVLREG